MNTAGFVTMGAAYAATHFIGQGLDKITLGVIDLSTIKGWIAADLKEEVERRAVDAAFDVMVEAGEGTLVSFLKKICVPESVAEGAVGGLKDVKEELGTETTLKAGLMIVEGVKGAVVGGVSAAGTGAIAGLAGGPGGVVGGAVLGGAAGAAVGGAKGVLLMSAATDDEAHALKNALQASGIKWVLTEFATYMKTHGEGGRKQMGNIINKSLSGYTVLSDDFCWGAGKQLRKFVTGTIVFLIKHMVVEKYYSDDPAVRRRAMYYRLGIAAIGHSQGLANLMSNSISYSSGVIGGLFEKADKDEYKIEDTLEYRYSFVINEALVMDAKKRAEELDLEAKQIQRNIEGLKAELSNASMARMSEVDYIDEHFGILGEKLEGKDRTTYDQHSQKLEALEKKELEITEKILAHEQALKVIEDKKVSAEILAPCSVSYKAVRDAKENLAIQQNIRGSAEFFIEQNEMRLQYLQTPTYLDDLQDEVSQLRSSLKLIQDELRTNKDLSDEQRNAYLSRERELIGQIIQHDSHVQHLESWVKTDVLKKDGTHNDHDKLTKALNESTQNYQSLKADAEKAIPGLEKAVKKAEAQFEKDKAAATERALNHATTLAQTPVGEAKKLIRLGMLYHDGHITKEQYNDAIDSIRGKIQELPESAPHKAGCMKALERFTLENLFPVGYRNTSTEEDKDGNLVIKVFNTEIQSFQEETEAATRKSVGSSIQGTLAQDIEDAQSVYGFDTDFAVHPQFLSDINDGAIKLEVQVPKSEVRNARDAMGNDALDDNELLVEKLFVASGYDAGTVSKITQLVTKESAEAMLAPLIESVKKGNDETGLGTELKITDIDNPEYVCQISETDTGVLITFTAKWDVEGHVTNGREHEVDGESSVEASISIHLTPGEIRKEAVEIDPESLPKPGMVGAAISTVGGWFGLGGAKSESEAIGPIKKIVEVQDLPEAEMRSCALVRVVRDTLEIKN